MILRSNSPAPVLPLNNLSSDCPLLIARVCSVETYMTIVTLEPRSSLALCWYHVRFAILCILREYFLPNNLEQI